MTLAEPPRADTARYERLRGEVDIVPIVPIVSLVPMEMSGADHA